MNNQFLVILLFSVMILANLNAFIIKQLLRKNGYAVKPMSGYHIDERNIFKLAKQTLHKSNKVKYLVVAWLNIVLTILFIVLVAITLAKDF